MAGKTTRRTSNEFEFKNSVIFADTNTTVTSTDLTTNDPVIAVNSGNTAVPAGGSGLEVTTSGTNPAVIYTPADSGKWSLTQAANIDFSGANLLNFSVSSLTNLTVTNFTSNNVDIGGGEIDSTPIGATAQSTGSFTDLTASGTVNLGTALSVNEFTGNVTGNIKAQDSSIMVNSNTKTFTGALSGAVTGDVTGDVKAPNATVVLQNGTDGTDATFRGNILSSDGLSTVLNVSTATPVFTGNVTGRVSTLDNFTTADLTEGANLYYTNARADARIALASINALSDVDTSGVTNNQVLIYNSGTSKFEPGAVAHSVANLQTDNDTGTAQLAGAVLNANPASGLTVSITPGGASNRVIVKAYVRYLTRTTGASSDIFVQLWRDKGTGSELLLAEEKVAETSGTDIQRQTSFEVFDTPGTGSHTYAVYYDANNNLGAVTPNPAYSTGGASQNYIVAEELLVQSSILTEIAQDTTPQLGGNLDANNFNINMGSGSVTVTGLPNPSNATDAANKQWVETQVATANELSELTDVDTTGAVAGSVLKYGGAGWIVTNNIEEITEVAEDTSPQLGGSLDLNGNNITGSGNITTTGNLNVTGNGDFTGNLVLGGNLTVNGTTTTIDVTTLEVDDPLIYLNRNASDNANNTSDSGVLIERGSAENHAGMIWDESADEFRFFTSPNITAATTVVTGMVNADIRAATAHVTATQAQYADLAELYTTDADYEPGTVMVFGGDAEVTQSMKSMDHTVAGVVSSDPAYLMNKDQKGKTVAIALRGKIPVSVIGPVKKGDLIVTSDEPGVGQAHAGVTNCVYVIGKCIEDDDTENLVRLINCVV